MRWKMMAMASAAALAAATPIAAEAPQAQRVQAITAQERAQGQQANAEIVREYGGVYDGPQVAYVKRVGQRVATQSGLATTPGAFTITVLDSPVDNAFATPGGYVYVTRGLLALMNDEAELAAVLGHEVAHVAARHSRSRQNTATRNTLLGALGQAIVGAVAGNSGFGSLLSRGIGAGAQLATLGYSRGQETEADTLGVGYLARTGYDPVALSTMLESLAAQNQLSQAIAGQTRALPAWASTHPEPGARVARARSEATRIRATGTARGRDAHLAAVDGLLYGDDPAQGAILGQRFVHPALRIGFTVPQGYTMANSPQAVTIVGGGGQAQFATLPYSGNRETYVRGVLQSVAGANARLPAYQLQSTTVNGIPAAQATIRAASGNTPVDVTVVALTPSATRAYHFVTVTPAGRGVAPFASTIQSFRTITAAEAGEVRARYVRVVPVGARDTVQTLAARMAFPDRQLERFLTLNGLSANERLTPGTRVKIVTH
ncbi:M48 family metalloprotease [Sphingomonas baiyangensis]|nr:M48 family metalloprotease [Sphingomonas baiyangensis]